LREEIEILEFWGEKGRAAGGTPQSNEMYQPGVGYFDLKTGRMTRPDDRNQQPSTPRGVAAAAGTAAGGGSGGGGAAGGGAQSFQPSSRARALMAAAQKLGVSPLDLATIISYETSGTFNPNIWGGKDGNHLGLIQIGGPERQKYGRSRRHEL
jgi:hypothetical protein